MHPDPIQSMIPGSSAQIPGAGDKKNGVMDTLLRDIRYAVRQLARQRAFTATAVTTLALGIGANTAMFSIVYGVLLRPLPYPDPEAIVRVGEARPGQVQSSVTLSNRSAHLLQEQVESFEQIAAYRARSVDWTGPDGVVSLRGATVSPSLFPLLRATPRLGRLFTEEEAQAGAERVVLLSHGAWTNRYAADPDIVGTALDFGGDPYTVVGVLTEGFYFPNPEGEFWTPFVIPPFTPPVPDSSGRATMTIVRFSALGRLGPGVSPEQAAAEAGTILQRRDNSSAAPRAGGNRPPGERRAIEARVVPLLEEMVGEYRPALLALSAATVLVLLIACVNVAGLLLARGVTRQRTLAICAALGAGRGRLVRQLLTESVVLSLGGGALGLAAAAVVLQVVPALVPGNIARLGEVGIDGTALAFTLGLSVVVGLLFGAAPAFQWSRLRLVRTLNEGSAQAAGGFRLLRSNRARAALATAQVALALVLAVGAGLLLRSFVGLVTVDRGYDPANVITARTRNPDLRPATGALTSDTRDEFNAATQRFNESLLEALIRMQRLPDVAAVGLSSKLPLLTAGWMTTMIRAAGEPLPSNPADLKLSALLVASPGYFDVMRLRLRRGRTFTRLDGAGSPPVLVVNETFVREVLDGEPAVGQRLLFGVDDDPWEVIGVVADIRYDGLGARESEAEAFISQYQARTAGMFGLSLPMVAVRTTGDPLAVIPFLEQAVAAAHPGASIDSVMTMDARLSAAIEQPRFYAVFVGCFAALALFLAAFGIYGLLSYTVSQRRREIGVRMALGAQRNDILALVVRQGSALVAAGAVLGLAAAAASARILESFLYGIATDDPLTFAAAPLVLVAVALAACWLPGLRATRINPMDALRVE